MQVVTPLTKYALTMTPVALSIEELLPSTENDHYIIMVFIRTVLVLRLLSTLVVALTFPYFGGDSFHACILWHIFISILLHANRIIDSEKFQSGFSSSKCILFLKFNRAFPFFFSPCITYKF